MYFKTNFALISRYLNLQGNLFAIYLMCEAVDNLQEHFMYNVTWNWNLL